jgi:hypothetical protein
MWPGLVGKGSGEGQEPAISLERMLQLTAAANVNGAKFDGIDYFLFLPHTDPRPAMTKSFGSPTRSPATVFRSGRSSPPSGRAQWAILPWAMMQPAKNS